MKILFEINYFSQLLWNLTQTFWSFLLPLKLSSGVYLVASNENPFIWCCLENNWNGGSGRLVLKKQICSEFLHKMFWEVYAMPFHEIKRAVSRFTISCHVRTKSFFTKSWFVFVCLPLVQWKGEAEACSQKMTWWQMLTRQSDVFKHHISLLLKSC